MWQEFRLAISFLTRLPLRDKGVWDEVAFSRATRFYPLVGLIVGIFVAVISQLCAFIHSDLAALAAVIAAIVVSGGIHLDGFMDTCDGVLASRGRERALAIMKDSHVGAFGVIGVILLLLTKYVLYGIVVAANAFLAAILCAAVLARLLLVVGLIFFQAARDEGLGATVKKNVSKASIGWGLLLLVLIALVSGYRWQLLMALTAAIIIMILVARALQRFLGGLTGDTYGAIAELSEPVFLFCYVLALFFSPSPLPIPLF